METLAYKVRLSALWLMSIVAFFVYRTLALSEGATEVSVLTNTELARVSFIMMVFGFLTLMLPRTLNRLTNIIAGSIFLVGQLIMLLDGLTAYSDASFNLMTGAAVAFLATVVGLAVRWPRDLEGGKSDTPKTNEV